MISIPREYQFRRSGHVLPHNVYKSVRYIILDYERMKNERERILHEMGMTLKEVAVQVTHTSDPTGQKAAQLAGLSWYIDGVEKAVREVTDAYTAKMKRDDIQYFNALGAFADYKLFCCLMYDPETGEEPCQRTWQRFKTMLAFYVAKYLLIVG